MKLNEIRARKGFNQWDLRLLTGIHQSKISLFESGYILPTDEERLKLAMAFGVDPGELDFVPKSFPHPHRSADVGAHQKFREV